MKVEFFPLPNLQHKLEAVLENIRRDGAVVITENEQPSFLMINIADFGPEEIANVFETLHPKRLTESERQALISALGERFK